MLFFTKKDNDRNEIKTDGKNITLREICRCLGIEVPDKYKKIAKKPQTLSFRSKRVRKGDICLIIRSGEDFFSKQVSTKDQYDVAVEKGASLIIMGREAFENAGLSEEDFPVILMDDANERVADFISKLRQRQKGKVVMVTGSIGKTTTKDFCDVVTKEHFDSFANKRNTNTPHQVVKHLFEEAGSSKEVYIQEAGAGYRGSVRFSAEMLKPDIFILTNVYSHHLQVYGSFENIFEDKVAADDTMNEGGVIITNFDDENIRKHEFKNRVISFAIDQEDVDYRGTDIKQDKDILKFGRYERKTGKTVPIQIHILGEHNVYNALAAYAMAKELGMTSEEIQERFSGYRTAGVRQNLADVGGVYINMDCYNVAEESIMLMLKAGEKMEISGKKYALLGGENKLGKTVRERSEKFGRELAECRFDKILFCGQEDERRASLNKYGDAKAMKEGFDSASDVLGEFSLGTDDMIRFLKENVRPGDLLMCKGIYLLDMPVAVDKVFGTSYSFDLSNYKETIQKIEEGNVSADLIPAFGELEITGLHAEGGVLSIPDEVSGYPVFRIRNKLFRNNDQIKEIDFGSSLKNIGASAFEGCTQIESLEFPAA